MLASTEKPDRAGLDAEKNWKPVQRQLEMAAAADSKRRLAQSGGYNMAGGSEEPIALLRSFCRGKDEAIP